MQRHPAPVRERIIELFAKRQPAYTREHVLRLLGITDGQLAYEIANLTFDTAVNDRGMSVFLWEDVAHLALEEWTPRMIEAALHLKTSEVIPHLNQHRLIQVSLPIYLIRYLHLRAVQRSISRLPRNASDILERILHQHADAEDQHDLDRAIPGFRDAHRYPYYTPRSGSIALRCRYCDISITAAGREVCKSCEERHEPKEHRGQYGITQLEPPSNGSTTGSDGT